MVWFASCEKDGAVNMDKVIEFYLATENTICFRLSAQNDDDDDDDKEIVFEYSCDEKRREDLKRLYFLLDIQTE